MQPLIMTAPIAYFFAAMAMISLGVLISKRHYEREQRNRTQRAASTDTFGQEITAIVKDIRGADNEDQIWRALRRIHKLEKDYHDNPDIWQESKDLRKIMGEQINAIMSGTLLPKVS
jgi:hypothetical protein